MKHMAGFCSLQSDSEAGVPLLLLLPLHLFLR
jgi:hypothetical protein